MQELQSLPGMVNCLHQFVLIVATVSSPLTDLAGRTVTWDRTRLHNKSFQDVKNTLAADDAVRPLNYNSIAPLYLLTDALLTGTDACVAQAINRNMIRSALLYSRKFNPVQENYSTFNKKLFAVADGLQHFRSVLTECKFTIRRDHKPPETFPKQYDLLGKQVR